MAFMLPLLPFIAGGAGGFVIGYMASGKNEEQIIIVDSANYDTSQKLNTIDLQKLKTLSPHKELKQELISFDKSTLKHSEKNKPHNTDSIVMQNIRKRLSERRKSITLNVSQ